MKYMMLTTKNMIKKLNILNGNNRMRLSFIQWLLYAKYFTLNTLFLKKKKVTGDIIIPILETRKQRFRDVQY